MKSVRPPGRQLKKKIGNFFDFRRRLKGGEIILPRCGTKLQNQKSCLEVHELHGSFC